MDGAGVSGLVAVVAWAALAGWIAAGVLLVLAHRRLEQLEREHTARKWDIVALRAELRALHRRPDEPSDPAASDPTASDSAGTEPAGTDPAASHRAAGPPAPLPRVPAASTDTGPPVPRRSGGDTGSRPDGDPAGGDPGAPVPAGGTPGRTRTAGATAWRRSHRRPVGRTRRRPS